MTDHPNCGTPNCCGNCPNADPAAEWAEDLDPLELIPTGAATMWDHIAGNSPQYIPPWEDQPTKARHRFITAFEVGLAAMAEEASP